MARRPKVRIRTIKEILDLRERTRIRRRTAEKEMDLLEAEIHADTSILPSIAHGRGCKLLSAFVLRDGSICEPHSPDFSRTRFLVVHSIKDEETYVDTYPGPHDLELLRSYKDSDPRVFDDEYDEDEDAPIQAMVFEGKCAEAHQQWEAEWPVVFNFHDRGKRLASALWKMDLYLSALRDRDNYLSKLIVSELYSSPHIQNFSKDYGERCGKRVQIGNKIYTLTSMKFEEGDAWPLLPVPENYKLKYRKDQTSKGRLRARAATARLAARQTPEDTNGPDSK